MKDLTTPERYAEAVHDVKLFLEGRGAGPDAFVAAAHERCRRARAVRAGGQVSRPDFDGGVAGVRSSALHAVDGDDADVFGYHYENQMLAVNLFHMRGGKIVDKREFFWEDMERDSSASEGFNPGEFFSALLKQVYLDQQYIPHNIYVPVDFEDRATLEEVLSEGQNRKVQIHVPQRGDKRSLVDLVGQNAKQAYDQRFRVMKPTTKADTGSVAGRAHAAGAAKAHRVLRHLAHPGRRDGRVDGGVGRRQDEEVGLPQVHHQDASTGVDDFASMREVVTRRYSRLQSRRDSRCPASS